MYCDIIHNTRPHFCGLQVVVEYLTECLSQVPISSTSTPEVAKPADTEPSTEMSVEERLSEAARTAEVASGHRTRLATGTVQRSPGRGGTTINLADRAKERAALRQGVAAPTSPGGRRGGRGGRKVHFTSDISF